MSLKNKIIIFNIYQKNNTNFPVNYEILSSQFTLMSKKQS